MGVRVLCGDYDGGPTEGAVLIDSVTDLPLPVPMFASGAGAEDFLQWHLAKYGDPRRSPLSLEHHGEWHALRCPACDTTDCSCPDCGKTCSQPHAAECRE